MNCHSGVRAAIFVLIPAAALAQTQMAPPEAGWPRSLATNTGTFSLYQPQVDKWDGDQYQAHAAVSLKTGGEEREIFGIIWIQARAQVDKESHLVSLREMRIPKVEFPSVADKGQAYQAALRSTVESKVPPAFSPIALDQLEASLAIAKAEKKAEAQPLRNDPPRLIFSTMPSVLVSVDGEPVWRTVKGTNLERAINTRALLMRDGGTYYLHVYDGWVQASDLAGSWSVAEKPPAALNAALQPLRKEVDLLDGAGPDSRAPKPTLSKSPLPVVHVSTTPAELVVTDGPPDYVSVPGTQLLYVKNTSGNVFKNLNDQAWYLLVSGRWYRAADLNGSWAYVDPTKLPEDFARIPDDSPKENVKASVPGTPQAREAVIANSIPQTAVVKREGTTPTPRPSIDGSPKLEPVEGTALQSVANASTPIIRAEDGRFYLVQNGIWFVGDSPNGPWIVATAIPAGIYSIPPSSPLHYVTYVRVYDVTPEVVYVGYTPGYFGTVIAPAGVVVYGTGYWYRPWIGTYWYPPPWTFGFGWSLAFTPWNGWAFGWGFGVVGVGWGWGYPRPWWGPYRWYGWGGPYRPVVWNSTTINVYQRYSANRVTIQNTNVRGQTPPGMGSRVGTAYNSRTGMPAAGQPPSIARASNPRSLPGSASAAKAQSAAGSQGNARGQSFKQAKSHDAPHPHGGSFGTGRGFPTPGPLVGGTRRGARRH